MFNGLKFYGFNVQRERSERIGYAELKVGYAELKVRG